MKDPIDTPQMIVNSLRTRTVNHKILQNILQRCFASLARTFSRSMEGDGRNFWSRVGIPTCRAHRASKTENRRLTTVTSENFVVAVAALSLFLFLLLSSGAFSPAYKREYTAVPLRPGAELCMYATCIHGSLARSRQDKRDPYILAWPGIDWPESGAEVRRRWR